MGFSEKKEQTSVEAKRTNKNSLVGYLKRSPTTF